MAKPKIRFIGFEDKWNKSSYSETFSFLRHNSLSRAELDFLKGSVKNVHYGDILMKFDNILDVNKESLPYIVDEGMALKLAKNCSIQNGDIIFADAAEDNTVGKCVEIVSQNEDSLVAGLHTIPARPLFKFSEHYLGYSLNANSYHNQLLPLIQGTKISSISKSALQKTSITYPSTLSEQQQIASYFKSLDGFIQGTRKKISSLKQLKSASLQSMFPQVGETKPRVRFEEFEGEWGKGKLSQFASRITRKNLKLESQLPLTISAIDGLISQNLFFNSIVASSNLSRYYLIKEGEFAYNKSYSNGYPFGAVKRLEKYDKGALSTLYIVFALNNNISSDYLVHFFDTTLWHSEVTKRAAEGARNHGLLNISAEDFLDIDIVFPSSLDEQQQIANFFRSLNNQISLETQRLDKLKQIKSACLDKMFV